MEIKLHRINTKALLELTLGGFAEVEWGESDWEKARKLRRSGLSWDQVNSRLGRDKGTNSLVSNMSRRGMIDVLQVRWSSEEDAKLILLCSSDRKISAICRIFPGRTNAAVASRIYNLKLRGRKAK